MGTKAGMTTWFMPNGEAVPCTVIALEEGNIVTQIQNKKIEGYTSIQIGYRFSKTKNTTKAELGHLKKTRARVLRHFIEFRIDKLPLAKLGQKLNVSSLF